MDSLSKKIAVLVVTGSLSACASIVGGRYQPVSVDARTASQSQSIVGADCTLTNDRGVVHVITPGTANVHRAAAPLAISCEKNGTKIGEASLPAHVRGMVWGNILFGGLIGIIVDFSDGAAHHYPQTATVVSQVAPADTRVGNGVVAADPPAGGATAVAVTAVAASTVAATNAQSGGLASLDPRIGRSTFTAAQNVSAREQCDSAIRVVMVDGSRALFEASCPAGAPIKIECQQDQCSSLHAGAM